MANNIYYIVDIPNPNMAQIYDVAVQTETSKRESLDGTKCIIKLPKGEKHPTTGALKNETPLTHAQVTDVINNNPNEWGGSQLIPE